jgi:squalene-hopene/tetraprenyl-beta-curcumene cyclase
MGLSPAFVLGDRTVMSHTRLTLVALSAVLVASAGQAGRAGDAPAWNAEKAARYLDQQQETWYGFSPAQQAQDTLCMSCHTTLPYALARPALGEVAPDTMTARMKVMYDSVEKRVAKWNEIESIYPSQADRARATEAVLNAVILVARDARRPKPAMSEPTKKALDILWNLQTTDGPEAGSWKWLHFGGPFQPWEVSASRYYGAALAAVAVGRAGKYYTLQTDAEKKGGERLRTYLKGPEGQAHAFNKAHLLWAAGELPGLLDESEKKPLIAAVVEKQRPDGGWNVAELVGLDNRTISGQGPTDKASDGYATGLVVYALIKAGVPQSDPAVKKGLAWLADPAHRGPDGQWRAVSLNKDRKETQYPWTFMNDAATGFAVLALTAK